MVHYLSLLYLEQSDNFRKIFIIFYILQNIAVLHTLGFYITTHKFTSLY
jgi:hypothetical protein